MSVSVSAVLCVLISSRFFNCMDSVASAARGGASDATLRRSVRDVPFAVVTPTSQNHNHLLTFRVQVTTAPLPVRMCACG